MKTMSMVRGSVMAAVVAVGVSLAGTAAARDEAAGITCVPDPAGGLSAVVCTIGSGGSASTFLGAFASDNGGKGGWVEFYSDDDGEWWVEHHADGGTSVGWDAGDFGGNYMNGPNLSFGSKEGSYNNKPKPAVKGKVTKGPKRSYASAKAAAMKKTATLASIAAPETAISGSAPIEVSLGGSGQCKATIIVQRNGQFVSSSGIVPMTFPSKRALTLPKEEGEYTIALQGRDGCLGQSKTTKVKVTAPRRINFSGLVSKR